MMDNKLLTIGAKMELARRRFFFYAQLRAPDFYKDGRRYLEQICDALQEFVTSDDHQVLIMNLPPRHGKSRTAGLFVEWMLGKDKTNRIMTGSYNETLSTLFSKNVRNAIQEIKADPYIPVYTDVFPGVQIKQGDGAMNLWSLEGAYNTYLATSPKGTATGFGCNLLIIDDLIKNSEEAYNELVKEDRWDWFTNTMLSRLEEGGKIIVIMTRWASDDLAGRVIDHYPPNVIRQITMKAVQDDGTMLCPDVLSAESCADKKKLMGLDIWSANYQQEPIDIKGRLYSGFKTYDDIPRDDRGDPIFTVVKNYTDTADEGDDYFCSIDYGVYNKEAYVLGVLYTQQPMEYTEPAAAKMMYADGVNVADIESNNGGRGCAREIERHLRAEYHSNKTRVFWFHQSKNKKARILSNATWVMEHIYFPKNWKDRWPEYYDAMMRYQREGKNRHDDAPDATTGIAEKIAGTGRHAGSKRSNLY